MSKILAIGLPILLEVGPGIGNERKEGRLWPPSEQVPEAVPVNGLSAAELACARPHPTFA
jgi:hypothetical protein